MARFTGLLGLITFLGLAYAFSTNRRAIRMGQQLAWTGAQVSVAHAQHDAATLERQSEAKRLDWDGRAAHQRHEVRSAQSLRP